MLTRLAVRNFKRFESIDIALSGNVVFIGPNNSGKTSALQALALWDVALRKWTEKRGEKPATSKRPGVPINRRDVLATPVPDSNFLWRNLHVRAGKTNGDGPGTQNIRIDIQVDGFTNGAEWQCGFEFDYTNDESFICRPIRLAGHQDVQVQHAEFSQIPSQAREIKIAYLPPMSGLAAVEPKWEPGRINVLLGEGQTAQVLRNLCYSLFEKKDNEGSWLKLTEHIRRLFGAELQSPFHVSERGEITMEYKEGNVRLDLACAGRGLQQTLLLLAYLYSNPKSIVLLDEPDAHLEILRQREIYGLITGVAQEQGSQIIAASHSEVVLNEAMAKDTVVAFVGKPHVISNKRTQVKKSLAEIGWEDYASAESMGWVLYLEGATDLSILQELAERLGHPVRELLRRPFIKTISTNVPSHAREHFYGLREAKDDLVGIALFDRIDRPLETDKPLLELMWERREIENYICTQATLMAYATDNPTQDLLGFSEAQRRELAMKTSIAEISKAVETLFGNLGPWSPEIKASDQVLEPIFRRYSEELGLPLQLRKTNFCDLARFVPIEELDGEISQKLDAIYRVASNARGGAG